VPTLIPKSAFIRALWKNGLGYTDQIAIEPPTADLRLANYLWRISSASITNASTFSVFPDHDRVLVILSDTGVRIIHTDDGFEDAQEVPPLEPYEFPGDIQSRCELLDGPVKDFSVFFRKGEINATVEVIPLNEETVWKWEPTAHWNFIFSARGNFEVCTEDGVTQTLVEGDAFRLDSASNDFSDGIEENLFYPVVSHGNHSSLISIRLWRQT